VSRVIEESFGVRSQPIGLVPGGGQKNLCDRSLQAALDQLQSVPAECLDYRIAREISAGPEWQGDPKVMQ
jgi:hypothetical protein